MKLRVRGMHRIRLLVRDIMAMQTRNCSDTELMEARQRLNKLYDAFVRTHGCFSDRANMSAFRQDNDYPLLSSMGRLDNEVTRLRVLKAAYEGRRYDLQDAFSFQYPKRIAARKKELDKIREDIQTRNREMEKNPGFEIVLCGRTFTEHKK